MKTKILTLFMLCLSIPVAWGQDFSLTSTTPSNGSTNLSSSMTVSFTFNKAVNTDTVDWQDMISREPYDSLLVNEVTFSSDQKTVHFHVTQSQETDFIWMVLDAVSNEGESLKQSYVLTYTTGNSLGANSVSGTISASNSNGTTVQQQATLTTHLAYNNESIERVFVQAARTALNRSNDIIKSKGNPRYTVSGEKSFQSSATAQSDFTKTIAFLLDSNYFGGDTTDDGSISAAAVIDPESGAYTMNYVRDGTYWPAVMKYDDNTSSFSFQVGFYDPDNDQSPDPIVVDGQSVTGVDMVLQTLSGFTAREGLNRADQVALELFDDSRLILINGYEIGYDQYIIMDNYESKRVTQNSDLTGKSRFWSYFYHSPSTDTVTMVSLLSSSISSVITIPFDPIIFAPDQTVMKTIPSSFVDSDDAIQVAEDNGGGAFRSSLSEGDLLVVHMTGGHVYHRYPYDSTANAPVYWDINYFAVTTDTSGWPVFKTISVYIDMESGQLLGTTATDLDEQQPDLPASIELGYNYPNPFNPTTSIPFELPASQHVNLTIYNLLGQRVAVLANQMYPAGKHVVTWEATEHSSGVYLYQLTSGTKTLTRKLVLLK